MIIICTIFVFFASLTFGQSLSLDVDRAESVAIPTAVAAELQDPFYLQLPFFRLTLSTEHGGGVFDVLPFEFPRGNKPQSLATATGDVTVRFVSRPLVEYKVALNVLAKIDTFEELVVDDLEKRLRTTGQEIAAIPMTPEQTGHSDGVPSSFPAAMKTQQLGDQLDQLYGYFEYFRHSPPKLKTVADKIVELYPQFLLVEAAFLSRKNDWQSALVRFDRIYRLVPNFPKLQPRWSEVCTQQVSFLVSQHRHHAARQLLMDFLQKYPDDTTSLQWKQWFYAETEKVLRQLRADIDQKQWNSAYEQWAIANELAPELPEVQQIKVRLTAECPRFVVAVGADWFASETAIFDTSLLRKQRLHGRTLFEHRGDEVEGRRYISPYGAVLSVERAAAPLSESSSQNQSKNDTTVPALNTFLLTLPTNLPLTSYDMVDILSRNILSLEPSGETFFQQFQCLTPQQLRLTATHPHPRPAAFLQNVFLPRVTPVPNLIVEKVFPVGETGLLVADSPADQLLAGELDAVANVYPWDIARLRKQVAQVHVEPYSAKRIHILVPNPNKMLPSDRLFRRALLYSLDREKMVSLLLCGETGAEVISGPTAKPSQFRDPIGYGYDTTIAPLPYHPQLAVLLLLMVLQQEMDVSETAIQPATLTPPTITLAVPPTEVAQVAARMIQRCWQAIGVHTNLVSTTDYDAVGTGDTVDFWYIEYPISEPFVDVPRLLMSIPGPDTVTPHLALEMEKLSKSQTWSEIGTAMRGIHRITASELTVLPLWQWTDYAAFRKELRNVKRDDTQKLEHLYENVEHW